MPYLKDADPLSTNVLCSKILTEVTKAALICFIFHALVSNINVSKVNKLIICKYV